MGGVEKIIENILADSDKASAQTVELAEKTAEASVSKAVAEAQKRADEIIKHANAEAVEIGQRAEGVAALEERKRVLFAKREVMDEVFDRLELHFMQLTGEEYIDFLAGLAKGEKGGELIFSEKDRTLGTEVVNKLGAAFTLSSETEKSIMSGYIIKNGAVQTHCTVQAVVAEKRRELEPGVAKILFEG